MLQFYKGEARRAAGQDAAAREAFETYLAKAPNADDRWLVEANLKKLTAKKGS